MRGDSTLPRGLTLMMLIACLRVPISFAMAIVGVAGYAYMRDWKILSLWLPSLMR